MTVDILCSLAALHALPAQGGSLIPQPAQWHQRTSRMLHTVQTFYLLQYLVKGQWNAYIVP